MPLVVVGALVATKPEIVRGTFSSAESLLRVSAVIAAWMLFSRLVRRRVPNPAVRTVVVAVPAAALLWFTVAPYFQEATVDEALPVVTAPPASVAPAAAVPEVTTPPTPAAPVKLSSGRLHGLDGHRGAGDAAIYRQPDGSHLLRLEDFDVSNTPGPVVYVVPGAGQENPGAGTKLGPLRGSQGNQNFTIPTGFELGSPVSVLIWCEPFAVAIAGASPAPV